MSLTIYGIRNCDTMKKARAWLDKAATSTPSTTTRRPASTAARLEGWAEQVGWEALLNRSGTTFRKLPDADKDGLTEKKAIGADAGATLDDQPAGPGVARRQAAGRLQARELRVKFVTSDHMHIKAQS